MLFSRVEILKCRAFKKLRNRFADTHCDNTKAATAKINQLTEASLSNSITDFHGILLPTQPISSTVTAIFNHDTNLVLFKANYFSDPERSFIL